MRRRRFLATTIAAIVAPRATNAQQSAKIHRVALVAFVGSVDRMSEAIGLRHFRALHAELRTLGYVDGQNLAFEKATAGGSLERVPELVREIVALKPDVVCTTHPRLVAALKSATATIPIVAVMADPVASGFAASLARPGGNITGFTMDPGIEWIGKRIALLREIAPSTKRMAWLTSRWLWESRVGRNIRDAGERAGVPMIGALLESPITEAEYRRVFAVMARERVDSVQVSAVSENFMHQSLIVKLCAEAKLPAIYFTREDVEAGGLMAYGIDLVDIWRRVAGYIDRILKGAKPADMPIQQPTKFELAVNSKTARALGLTIPESMLVQADVVIE